MEASSDKFETDRVAVVYTPAAGGDQEFPRAKGVAQCGDKVGWYDDDPDDPTTVVVCPTACEVVPAGGSVHIAFDCMPQSLLCPASARPAPPLSPW